MVDYIENMLETVSEEIKGVSATPAAHYPFDISKDAIKFSRTNADLFHYYVAQLVYLSNQARLEMKLVVPFLCTIFIELDIYKYKSLTWLTKYIQCTIGLPLILSIDKYGNIKWYFDAVFPVHKDMSSHNGGSVTMGTGGACVKSRNQKLNTKSSTESDLVGVYNVLIHVIWTQYFLKEQGYKIHYNVIYQDNHGAIKLEKNFRQSSIKHTRHINIMYYFITDSIKKQESSVEFCTTLYMMGGYFIKALQGYQFLPLHNIILGIHKYNIPYYNVSGIALIDEQKIKLERSKEVDQKSVKLVGE